MKGIWPPPHERKSRRRLTLVKKSGMLKLGFLKKLKRVSWRRIWKHLLLQQQLSQYYKGRRVVLMADNSRLSISHVGKAVIPRYGSQQLQLEKVYHVPSINNRRKICALWARRCGDF